MQPRQLPIYEVEDSILQALAGAHRAILSAPTGSGKSTQVPQMLLDHGLAGDGDIIVLQPRRLAARMLADRVARERGVSLGGEIGYQVRLENRTSSVTRVRYITEGILLRRLIDDPDLRGVSIIVFDEFHERHIYGDVTLARALQLQQGRRPDLRLLVMSATLDLASLELYLAPCPVIESAGRTFPVDINYLPRTTDFTRQHPWDVAAEEFEQMARTGLDGDILVFMPGAYEIRRTIEAIRRLPASRGYEVFPLHGELPPAEQDAAVSSSARPKIVVATNVAETSITIDGVRTVIDCGLARVHRYDPYRGINTLLIEKISRAAADQRAGRAGRTAPGRCIRLWSERQQGERALREQPEILRIDLAEVLLSLKAGGIDNIADFPWIDPPLPHAVERAVRLLQDLGATDPGSGAITELGRRMLSFPLHPRYARMLLAAQEFQCVREAALAAALTQDRSLLIRNPGKPALDRRADLFGESHTSDLVTLIRAFGHANRHGFRVEPCRDLGIHAQAARQVGRMFSSFLDIATRQGLEVNELPASEEDLARCILVGFVDQLARRLDQGTRRCAVVHGRKGELDASSIVTDSPFLVASEIHEIEGKSKDLRVRLSLVTGIREEWLAELFPQHIVEEEGVDFDASGKRVVAVHRRRFLDLILESRTTHDPSPELAAALLAQKVIAGDFTLKQWDVHVEQWIHRLNSLASWCPELQLPTLTEADRHFLIEQICHGCLSAKQVKDRPVKPVLYSWLAPGQQALIDQFAPERIQLPCGRRTKITYASDGAPTIAARIQDLYGVKGSLTVAMDRVKLVIQVLGPNQRPVQVTDNLAGFWEDTYPSVKQQLQRKYPRHEWRDPTMVHAPGKGH